jgi:hypothetical protein
VIPHEFWAGLLIFAAAVSLALLVRRIRAGRISAMAAAGGVLFRLGLMIIGALFLTGTAQRSPAAFLAGLAVVAAGAVLNLAAAFTAWLGGRGRE